MIPGTDFVQHFAGHPASGLVIGPIVLNGTLRSVSTLDGRPLHLTAREFQLLEIVADGRGETVPWDTVSRRVFGRPRGEWEDACLRDCLHGLRQALPLDEQGHQLVRTVRGVGLWMRSAAL